MEKRKAADAANQAQKQCMPSVAGVPMDTTCATVAADPYVASHIKRRRATGAEMLARRVALHNIVIGIKPCTVRQAFYQATVAGIIDKTEAGYLKVQRLLVEMRRDGWLSHDWIVDNTRWQRKPATYRSLESALQDVAEFYRRDLWADADAYVEIWLEKDALAGVVLPVTERYDVPLMVARGYASESFLHSAAQAIAEVNKPAFIYHLGRPRSEWRQRWREHRGRPAPHGPRGRDPLRTDWRDGGPGASLGPPDATN
ncbi:hypothetical protein [Cupriavidus sp. AcVe19-6a]|uniref:hypothetical protein n=1 Tax=Cupriavidus sp. AcVe19-6a TaxID=2821358 RepID=UPI001AE4067B|nr:hypothetical protein [Cupriavidus sp. AcVe19-6a]MBP0639576.1 hypothetical protein [Cupriavidus sp. AcVe19-6a]